MKRQYLSYLAEFLEKKLVLVTGPRQSGKTTLAKTLRPNIEYLNFDLEEHRQILLEKSWDRRKDLLIFDEIHKMRQWKSWLKGIYDVEGLKPPIIVTGSAKLDTYRKVGDSLAGRYFQYRLHPLDVRELHRIGDSLTPEQILDRIMSVGGFPEPFLEGNQRFYNLWKKTHLDIILKQDLIVLENISEIKSIELLLDLLKARVGSPISYSSLAGNLNHSDKTIKRWLIMLENIYLIFKLTPYHKNITRSNLKQPKYYFYDCGRVLGDDGVKLENAVACSLLKECQFRNDCLGEDWELKYLSKRGGREIDFVILKDQKPEIMIEVKLSEDTPSRNFSLFSTELPNVKQIQLVKNLKREKTYPSGVEIRNAATWLTKW